jgi:hypothetical protein
MCFAFSKNIAYLPMTMPNNPRTPINKLVITWYILRSLNIHKKISQLVI